MLNSSYTMSTNDGGINIIYANNFSLQRDMVLETF